MITGSSRSAAGEVGADGSGRRPEDGEGDRVEARVGVLATDGIAE